MQQTQITTNASAAETAQKKFGSITRGFIAPVVKRFKTLCTFTASARVDSEAMAIDRTLCEPGDTVEVIRWHCLNGPTEINVTTARGNYRGRAGKSCIPFGWVLEMGAPQELSQYMPFAPHTWEEITNQLAS